MFLNMQLGCQFLIPHISYNENVPKNLENAPAQLSNQLHHWPLQSLIVNMPNPNKSLLSKYD